MAVERVTYVKCDRYKREQMSFTDCSKKVAIHIARKHGFTIKREVMCPCCSNLYLKR